MLCQSLCKFESWILSELLKFKIFDLQNSSLVLLTFMLYLSCYKFQCNVAFRYSTIYEHIESFYFVYYKLFCQSKANCFILHFFVNKYMTQTLLT